MTRQCTRLESVRRRALQFKIAKCLRENEEMEGKIDMKISGELHGEHGLESRKYRQKNPQTGLTRAGT